MTDRNLNPHAEARLAMSLWGQEYSRQNGGCMDFWDGLSASRKRLCIELIDEIRALPRASETEGRQP